VHPVGSLVCRERNRETPVAERVAKAYNKSREKSRNVRVSLREQAKRHATKSSYILGGHEAKGPGGGSGKEGSSAVTPLLLNISVVTVLTTERQLPQARFDQMRI
jgi:hypothetical protein